MFRRCRVFCWICARDSCIVLHLRAVRRNARWLRERCTLQSIMIISSPCMPSRGCRQLTEAVAGLQEWEKLWTINKRLIDPVAPRHTAVTAAGRVLLTLSNGPEVGIAVEVYCRRLLD